MTLNQSCKLNIMQFCMMFGAKIQKIIGIVHKKNQLFIKKR